MRRRHNVIVGTILVIGIILLLAQTQEDDSEDFYETQKPRTSQRPRHGSKTMLEKVLATLTNGPASTSPTPQPLPGPFGPLPHSPTQDIPGLRVTDNIVPHIDQTQATSVPQLLSLDLPFPPAEQKIELQAFRVDFPFQNDLEVDFPIDLLKGFINHKPHNYEPNGPKTYTYATFMATRNPSLKDPYYLAIHSLIYRLLWSQRSRTEKYPFVVFVGDFVTAEQRALLSGAGAIVRELAPLEWNPNVEGVQSRWKDLFAKLNMWKETEFERIHFLDADAFPLTNLDDIFNIAPVQKCDGTKMHLDDLIADGTSACEHYIFAGVPQDPISLPNSNINVGSMVLWPSVSMHKRLVQNYVKTDNYDCLMAEQAFLDWQFRLDGPFPPTALEREWGGFFPQPNEEGKLKVVHQKIWIEQDGWMKKEWDSTWDEMLKFYASSEFLEARGRDGLVSSGQ